MAEKEDHYRLKKVISIGTVCELTGLSERQIRYYEERKLVFPKRTKRGTRKYSFEDVENLMEIANKMEEGTPTIEIRREMDKAKKKSSRKEMKKQMIQGLLNAHFKKR